MVEFIREKTVKTRKDHKCHGCSTKIQSKTENILVQTFSEDTIYHLYFCLECQSWLKNKCEACRECFILEDATEGFIYECRKEIR